MSKKFWWVQINVSLKHWIALYVNGENSLYSDSFRAECIPKKKKKIDKEIKLSKEILIENKQMIQ